MKKNIHVLYKDEKWISKEENSDNILKSFDTKDEAIEYSRKIAIKNKVELIIHNINNKISNRDSYGNDSYPPNG